MTSLSVLVTVLTLLPFLCLSFSPESLTHRRLLVLLDDHSLQSLQSSHSSFFHSLVSRGFDLDFKLAEDPKLSLQRYGQYLYDGLVLFSPSAHSKLIGFGGALDVQSVLDFVDAGHDLILAADASASDLIRSIAKQCGVNFDECQSLGLMEFLRQLWRGFERINPTSTVEDGNFDVFGLWIDSIDKLEVKLTL